MALRCCLTVSLSNDTIPDYLLAPEVFRAKKAGFVDRLLRTELLKLWAELSLATASFSCSLRSPPYPASALGKDAWELTPLNIEIRELPPAACKPELVSIVRRLRPRLILALPSRSLEDKPL